MSVFALTESPVFGLMDPTPPAVTITDTQHLAHQIGILLLCDKQIFHFVSTAKNSVALFNGRNNRQI